MLASFEPAYAGPYQDALVKCFVSKTMERDQEVIARWIVLAFASHPSVSGLVEIKRDRISEVQQDMAELTERLFIHDCLLEAREAARFEGESAVVQAFNFLAQTAGRAVMSNPAVGRMLDDYVSKMDAKRFEREIFGD